MTKTFPLWLTIPILFLAGAFIDWDGYGYYQLLRLVVTVSAGFIAYTEFQKLENLNTWAIVFGAIALLFQPFVKISFGADVWLVIDVITAVIFLIWGLTKESK